MLYNGLDFFNFRHLCSSILIKFVPDVSIDLSQYGPAKSGTIVFAWTDFLDFYIN